MTADVVHDSNRIGRSRQPEAFVRRLNAEGVLTWLGRARSESGALSRSGPEWAQWRCTLYNVRRRLAELSGGDTWTMPFGRDMSMLRNLAVSVALLTIGLCGSARALVGDPQIMTDHPVYRGELSCSTLDRNIADAYRIFEDRYGHDPKTDTEKLFAIWAWKVEHGVHSADNRVYVGPDDMDALQDGAGKGLDGQPRLPDEPVLLRLRPVLQHPRPDERDRGPGAGQRPEAGPLPGHRRPHALRGLRRRPLGAGRLHDAA